MILEEWLTKNKITISQFARQINYGKGNLSRLLRGQHKPSLKTLLKIQKATNNQVLIKDWEDR